MPKPRVEICTSRNVLLALAVLALGQITSARAGPHPRLLLKPDDIPRLKHACGIAAPGAETRGLGRSGVHSDAFNALRGYFTQRLGDVVLPGELAAAAFLHLVSPHDAADAARLALINNALTQPVLLAPDALELVLALDWCWEGLDPAARREFLLQMRRRATTLTPADSPLDHRVFREKLTALALAVAVDENDEPSPSWAALRERILEAGRRYFADTFPTYVAWRGLIPTGPAVAAFEENDAALMVELAGLLTATGTWSAYRQSVGRWLEHYVLTASEHPALQHQFLRDDGSSAPPTPAPRWQGLLPLTAHLIAARTHDPTAAHIADRVEAAMHSRSAGPLATLWRWVPAVFDLRDVRRVDTSRLPPARRLDGAIVLRGTDGPGATVIWIDAGQPFLRRGQHFDAGNFLIRAGGHLLVEGGDDVEFEATRAKQGLQRLGKQRRSFDLGEYFTATIAHNCMLFWDPARVVRWYGRLYAPSGGQLPREGTCTDFVAPLDAQSRLTAKLLAYGRNGASVYVALDLTPAYDTRTLAHYTREFLFLSGRVLIVIDRAETANTRVIPTWVANVPSRPRVDGEDLASSARTAGSENDAGVWRYDDAQWVHWRDREGSLWLRSLLPRPKRLAVVGGPARKLVIDDGPHEGRTYVGGDADTFERLLLPSGRPNAANAWYRLGSPTLLGPQFGIRPHWGRIEIESPSAQLSYLFVNALVIDEAAASRPPEVNLQETDGRIIISMSLKGGQARIMLLTSDKTGGELRIEAPELSHWTLPSSVASDEPLPAR